ncbi:MAG: DUF3570 domain-containing protein [Thiomargarita sp.]|nr:DUF3570 domain-containing protein [Thiomargarita sp.]
MQLIHKKIRGALTVATCSLLGLNSVLADEGEWDIDTAVLFYSETDRVTAIEPVISLKREYEDEKILSVKLVIDVLTGSSASGATPSDEVQTFTRPSGEGSYTTEAGETPLDDSFKDTRVAVSAQWEQPLNRDYNGSFGSNISKEYDYLSLGLNGTLSRYFNNRNTTITTGLSYAHDAISPEGGIPQEFSSMAQEGFHNDFNASRSGNDETKDTIDVLFGVTQVIDRRTLMQVNYSFGTTEGYLTDPFKILSVVGEDGRANDYVYENRPNSRTKHSLYWQTKHHFNKDIVDISYRYMWDDWDITSHTLELRYRWKLSNQDYLEPHFRYYMQSGADFYQRYLLDGEPLPEYATADYRLGELTGITFGLKYGRTLSNGHDMSVRLEYYQQSGDANADNAPGILQQQALFPNVEAIIFQLSYSL